MSNVVPFEFRRIPNRERLAVERAVYTVKEVAYLLSLSLGNAYELVRDGTIPAERLGRRWVVPRKRFHAWLDDEPEPLPADHSATGLEQRRSQRGA
ncbi:MAG: helix-turn-helix domain-containing protein [Sciscionella sp.]